MSDDEMNDIPDDEDPDDDPLDDEPDDDDSDDEYSNMSEEELKRESKRLGKEIDYLDKSVLVLNSLSKHSARLQEILAAIEKSLDSDSGPSPRLIGERRYVERQILLGINSLSEFDPEAFEHFSSEYKYIATRLETSEEEEENRSSPDGSSKI